MVSYIYEAIGNLLGVEKPPEELGDPIDFEPGVLLDSGISWVYVNVWIYKLKLNYDRILIFPRVAGF